jgi:hypothetical protein
VSASGSQACWLVVLENERLVAVPEPLDPAAQTIVPPGTADADESWLTVPAAGLETVVQAEPL